MTAGRERRHLGPAELARVALAAVGSGRRLHGVERLAGGTAKGVYRLSLDDATSVIAYVWNPDEDYWAHQRGADRGRGDGAGNRSDRRVRDVGGLALDRFERVHRELSDAGARVPRVMFTDRSGGLVPGAVAVVEDVRGGSLEQLCGREPERAEAVVARLGDMLTAVHARRRDCPGELGLDLRDPESGDPAVQDRPVPTLVLDQALRHLASAASGVPRIAAARDRLAQLLRQRHAAVRPRAGYGLIHGELGPDHVLVDDRDRPVLIDIEGAGYFDLEWEHAFLELRFGPWYRRLVDRPRQPDLDPDRLALYRPAMYLSLIAGPLRLLDGDFPDRPGMLGIIEANVERALAQLG